MTTRSADCAVAESTDPSASITRSALALAAHCHAGQRRESDDALFVEHPLEVARLLRDAGCSGVVVAAGLLHDVVENTAVSLGELRWRFGAGVADLVRTVTQDLAIEDYRRRKRELRDQVSAAGGDAALVFAADKISKVRELPGHLRRDRAPLGPSGPGTLARDHRHREYVLRLEHYRESLQMLRRIAPRAALVVRLADELAGLRVLEDPRPVLAPSGLSR